MTRRYYTKNHLRRWAIIQQRYTLNKEYGRALAYAYGIKLAERDMRDPSRLELKQ